MNNEDFDQIFSPQHLKELALCEINAAAKECTQSGYDKQITLRTVKLILKFSESYPDAPELATLKKLSMALLSRLQEKAAEPPKAAEQNPVTASPVDTAFPLHTPEKLSPEAIYNTAIIENKNYYYSDNTLLLFSPFEAELLHLYRCYAAKREKPYRVVDLAALLKEHQSTASSLLGAVGVHAKNAENELIVFLHPEAVAQDPALEITLWECLYQIREAESKTELLLLSCDLSFGAESKYSTYIQKAHPPREALEKYLSVLDTDYIPLVSRAKTFALIQQKLPLPEEDSETFDLIDKCGIFLGWSGLNDLLSDLCEIEQLRERLQDAKARHKKALDTFIEIGNGGLSRFDLLDWKYTRRSKKTAEMPTFDPDNPILNPVYTLSTERIYDTLISNAEIYDKLERLMNVKDFPLLAKCAWAADFAMKGGDQLNLINIPPENEKEFLTTRWDLAFRAVARLLLLDPPNVVFNISTKDTLTGQCCDGGSTIRMSKKYLHAENVEDGINTLLHEMFHALQHNAQNALMQNNRDVLGYYYHHFRISPYRITQWKENFSRYRSGASGHDDYYDQVVEAEARIFAEDAINENGAMHHPRLYDTEDTNS